MKIKRYQASDMRQTIRMVREELGPDAVILSNQRINGTTEIVAAVDYDESLLGNAFSSGDTKMAESQREDALRDIKYSRNLAATEEPPLDEPAPHISAPIAQLPKGVATQDPTLIAMQSELKTLRGLLMNQLSGLAWGQESRLYPLRARLLQRLMALGLSPSLARQIANETNEHNDFEHIWRHALGSFSHRLMVTDNDILSDGGVVALIGPTGVGKTTTVAKLAARYILQHGSQGVVLVTTDSYRIAAHEQLRTYARILGVTMHIANDSKKLHSLLQGMRHKGLVLIDTAGMSQRDMRLCKQFAYFNGTTSRIKIYLVLATNTQRSVTQEVIHACKDLKLTASILTKVDETTSLGGVLSEAAEHRLPIAYISDGQKVPEDLHVARAHSLVSRSVAIMQQYGTRKKDDSVSLAVGGMVANAQG